MKVLPERSDGLPMPGSSASMHWLLGYIAAHENRPYNLSDLFNNQHSRRHWQDGYLSRKEISKNQETKLVK